MSIKAIEKDFIEKVSEKIKLSAEGEERFRVLTPFQFEDGDQLVIVLKRVGDRWILSDEAHTYLHLTYDIDENLLQSGSHRKFILKALSMFDVEDIDGELMLDVSDGRYGEALYDFAQALLKITDVSYLSGERVQSTLKEHIGNIHKRLEQKIFKSETAVRQGIVDPILRSLAWPTEDTQIVFPEYPVGEGRVDYALCDPPGNPRVFIEAKQVGRSLEEAEAQLSEYDSYVRVPIAIATDGQKWRFFHLSGEGRWNREVCELDIFTGDSKEIGAYLDRHLNYELICSGAYLKISPTAQPSGSRRAAQNPKPGRKRSSQKRLRVTMPNREVVEGSSAKATFVEVIGKLGIEEVRHVDPTNVISISTDQPREFWAKCGQYYINTYSDTAGKKNALDKIAQDMGVKLTVKIIPK